MAIDDFSMSAVVPEPATLAFALGLLAGLAVWLRRRR
jgi:MYXO-CTERM domain-containing protein